MSTATERPSRSGSWRRPSTGDTGRSATGRRPRSKRWSARWCRAWRPPAGATPAPGSRAGSARRASTRSTTASGRSGGRATTSPSRRTTPPTSWRARSTRWRSCPAPTSTSCAPGWPTCATPEPARRRPRLGRPQVDRLPVGRVDRRRRNARLPGMTPSRSRYDAIVVGAGHNGLVTACYLARTGLRVLVLERREVVGGACVTEETFPGFKVSTAAYVNSLFRKEIVRDLRLKEYGFEVLERSPSSFTPFPDRRSLLLGPDAALTHREIAKFSARDAERYPRYEAMLERAADFIEPTL